MSELTCIICPMGCSLNIGEGAAGDVSALVITGNRCPRGLAYAREETLAPKRVVTATCGIAFETKDSGTASDRGLTAPGRVPVKSSLPCPKDRINDLLRDIYGLRVNLPVNAGDRLITNWNNSGIDVVAVRTLTE